ncbi:MAG: Family 2 glycosyl transferase [Candidatus Roizmanbacteria bacterium GW2011_GWC2_37_13]|uniref:Family 2 glycosyl transferase n=1 Tax=Candidatus Roizmanbacteria bacterium GW2011_GWC2_37_13 TaxID=1618486 RepID=A0A0G0IR99_9BACT|nr:MAG: glycosyl transferase, group 1/2 family protein [Candidatus Roizmanbacteria bacterium GW2011_GWC1_37_12]KKQ26684.1 MAG: Family 2 glycosyl transferase [Candidatus Roizmanbacteria bacterium GW2011_GWC2_37_13]
MKVKITVVIPTLNNVKGLKYLLNYFKDKPYKVVIIDNKKKNLGFAGGVNKGAKDVKTKWMLILNDDIEFYDDTSIKRLIEVAEKSKLDAVSPILVNPNGEVENYGYQVFPYGKIKLIKELRITNYELDGLTAACLLIKTNVFKKLKGFDERFFAYLEDVDFFLRFKKAGYKMGIVKDAKVLHNHMTTTKTMGNFKARQDMVNWWRLYFKHKDIIKFNWKFVVERLRNVSGFIKASFLLDQSDKI